MQKVPEQEAMIHALEEALEGSVPVLGPAQPQFALGGLLERVAQLSREAPGLGTDADTARGLRAFRRIADTLGGKFEVQEICDQVVHIFAEDLHLESCSIMLMDESEGCLVLQAGAKTRTLDESPEKAYGTGRRFRMGEGVAGTVAVTRQPILIPDVSQDRRFIPLDSPVDISSILCLPMLQGERVVGAINLSHSEKAFFNDRYLEVFTILSTIVGQLVTFAQLRGEMETLNRAMETLNRTLEERVRARTDEIREAKEYLENLLENASDLIFTVDLEKRVTFINGRIEDCGYSRQELVGRPLTPLLRGDGMQEAWERCLSVGERQSMEMELSSRPGTIREYLCSLTPLRDSRGKLTGALGIARDVTEKKRLERKLAQTERLASLGELVAGIAHELNNKLVPILAYSELLQTSPLDARDLRMVHTVTTAALGAKQVVESLLGFARQEKLRKALINLNDVLQTTLTVVKYRLKTAGIRVHLDLDPSLPRTLADFHQMDQVFLNIIGNAEKAMEESGGGTLSVRSRLDGDWLVVEVTDTGPGIPEEIQARIFDPFFTTKEVGEGTGLGLSLCYGIVNEHQGDISLTSRSGETRVTVRLPLIRQEPAPQTLPEGQADLHAEAPSLARVLVVDDEETQLALLQEVLAPRYEVTLASTGLEAIAALEEGDFDLIITDIRMPHASGIRLFEWIRAHRPRLQDRVVFVTGDTYDPRVGVFLQEVHNPCLTKPYRLEEVHAVVAQALSQSRKG